MGAVVPALVLAVCDWIAVATGARKVEYVLKPLTMLALIGAALDLGDDNTPLGDPMASTHTWAFVIVALSFSLLGDVFLMLPSDRFVYGLAAFLVAHVCYIVAFARSLMEYRTWAVAAVVAVVSLLLYARIRRGLIERGKEQLLVPVTMYVVVISLMVVAAVGTVFVDRFAETEFTFIAPLDDPNGSSVPLVRVDEPDLILAPVVGAILFYISDALIGWTRFVREIRYGRVSIMVTYHLGQMGLVLSLVRYG